jgi:polyisoprenyl-phosphate glycosyltransferase
MSEPYFSVVVPVFNEEENLEELHAGLVAVMQRLGAYELIYIDDGSTDGSRGFLEALCRQDANAKLISFSRNFGHQPAVSAGLMHARGDAVAIIDSDLQDPPGILPSLFSKWKSGYQVVFAVRKKRKESTLKRFLYFSYYRILHALSEIIIPVDSGDFCVMDRKVVDQINSLPERERFVRGLRAWVGFRQIGVEYERQARFSGTPKYTMSKLFALAISGIFSFSSRPLLYVTRAGVGVTLVGFGFLSTVMFRKLVFDVHPEGWTSLMAVVLFLGGIQLFVMGVIGEYIGKIFTEAKGRPTYIISSTQNLES